MGKKFQLLIAAVVLAAAAIIAAADAGEEFIWIQKNSPETCQEGSIFGDECVEISRRMLVAKTYIGYGALAPDYVPCSPRGGSYYGNCEETGQANPYHRSCTSITKCDRSG